jgi:hypothetical protein
MLFQLKRAILAVQIPEPVAGDAMAQNKILDPRLGGDRVRLNKPDPSNRPSQRVSEK